MNNLLQLSTYLIVGGFITLADLFIYALLTGPAFRFPRIPANVVSVSCGMILGFTLHFLVVFHPQQALLPARIVKYLLTVGISVYVVQNLVIHILANVWRSPVRAVQTIACSFELPAKFTPDFLDRVTGKACACAVGMAWNFIFFKFFVYA